MLGVEVPYQLEGEEGVGPLDVVEDQESRNVRAGPTQFVDHSLEHGRPRVVANRPARPIAGPGQTMRPWPRLGEMLPEIGEVTVAPHEPTRHGVRAGLVLRHQVAQSPSDRAGLAPRGPTLCIVATTMPRCS